MFEQGTNEKLAIDRGLLSLWGDTLPTNAEMISVDDQLSFACARHPEDFKLKRMTKHIYH